MHPPDPLRLCSSPECTAPKHYENCSRCLGFGLRYGSSQDKMDELYAIHASEDLEKYLKNSSWWQTLSSLSINSGRRSNHCRRT